MVLFNLELLRIEAQLELMIVEGLLAAPINVLLILLDKPVQDLVVQKLIPHLFGENDV